MRKIVFIQCLAIFLTLAGCGIRPSHVDPPASVTNDTFPQTYPPAAHGDRYTP